MAFGARTLMVYYRCEKCARDLTPPSVFSHVIEPTLCCGAGVLVSSDVIRVRLPRRYGPSFEDNSGYELTPEGFVPR